MYKLLIFGIKSGVIQMVSGYNIYLILIHLTARPNFLSPSGLRPMFEALVEKWR